MHSLSLVQLFPIRTRIRVIAYSNFSRIHHENFNVPVYVIENLTVNTKDFIDTVNVRCPGNMQLLQDNKMITEWTKISANLQFFHFPCTCPYGPTCRYAHLHHRETTTAHFVTQCYNTCRDTVLTCSVQKLPGSLHKLMRIYMGI